MKRGVKGARPRLELVYGNTPRRFPPLDSEMAGAPKQRERAACVRTPALTWCEDPAALGGGFHEGLATSAGHRGD